VHFKLGQAGGPVMKIAATIAKPTFVGYAPKLKCTLFTPTAAASHVGAFMSLPRSFRLSREI
jgi:hypothetical protein